MRLLSTASLAVEVSKAGGIGFLAAGSDVSGLSKELESAKSLLKATGLVFGKTSELPIGVGFLNWNADLSTALDALRHHPVAAVWLFAPKQVEHLVGWVDGIRHLEGYATKVWVQIGTVAEALAVVRVCTPDVIVVQGTDAGGHLLKHGASIVTLVPELIDALATSTPNSKIEIVAAGGISEGRSAAAAFTLGASGVAMGTRFLASDEVQIAKGYQRAVLDTSDGGASTVKTNVYDILRGTSGWPGQYTARSIINESFKDWNAGMPVEENQALYKKSLQRGDRGWDEDKRLTAYAGTGVGLVKEVMPASAIVKSVQEQILQIFKGIKFQ
jgi:nitronate monooxygenase